MKLVLPREARPGIVESAHQGHFSPETIYKDFRKYYFWPQMKTFVEAKANTCQSCREFKKSKPHQHPVVPAFLRLLSLGKAGQWI